MKFLFEFIAIQDCLFVHLNYAMVWYLLYLFLVNGRSMLMIIIFFDDL